MLRHGRLAHVEPLDQVVHGPLTLAEQIQDLPARRLSQCLDGCHEAQYNQRGIYVKDRMV